MKLPESDARPRSDATEPTLVRPPPAQPPAAVPRPEAPLADRRFLVVEDESLIALDLVDTLEKLGADEARAVSTEQEASVFIRKR